MANRTTLKSKVRKIFRPTSKVAQARRMKARKIVRRIAIPTLLGVSGGIRRGIHKPPKLRGGPILPGRTIRTSPDPQPRALVSGEPGYKRQMKRVKAGEIRIIPGKFKGTLPSRKPIKQKVVAKLKQKRKATKRRKPQFPFIPELEEIKRMKFM